jgi:hypothetical protein
MYEKRMRFVGFLTRGRQTTHTLDSIATFEASDAGLYGRIEDPREETV